MRPEIVGLIICAGLLVFAAGLVTGCRLAAGYEIAKAQERAARKARTPEPVIRVITVSRPSHAQGPSYIERMGSNGQEAHVS